MTGGDRTSLEYKNWPDLDKKLWETAVKKADFLEADGTAAHWSDATKLQVQKGYSKWLFFQNSLNSRQKALNIQPSLRISEPSLKNYLNWLFAQKLASQTIASRMSDLTEALRVM